MDNNITMHEVILELQIVSFVQWLHVQQISIEANLDLQLSCYYFLVIHFPYY